MKKTAYHAILLTGIAISLFLPKQAASQKLSKYYSSLSQDYGTIYHIPSIEPFSAKNPGKELQYDITYLDSKDSILINISYFSRETLMPDSILITGKNFHLASSLEKIFIDTKKGVWTYRYGFPMKYEDGQKFFDLKEPPSFCIKDKNAQNHPCNISQWKWEKSASIVKQIFAVVDMNKKN